MSMALLEFADKLNSILPVIMREFARQQNNELYKGKITLPQLLILEFINRWRESKMTDLARFMGVSTAAMTGIVERLVRDNYSRREYDPKDRRVIKIKLTLKGSELLKRVSSQRRQMVIKIFGKISESDRQEYLRILGRIHEILKSDKTTQTI